MGGITEEEARYLLENDIGRVRDRLDRKYPWWRNLSENRQHVMIDLSFNLGNRLDKFVNFLANMEAGLYDAAAFHLMDSLYAKQVKGEQKETQTLSGEGDMEGVSWVDLFNLSARSICRYRGYCK